MDAVVRSHVLHYFRCDAERAEEGLFASVAFFTNAPQICALVAATPVTGPSVVNDEGDAMFVDGLSAHLTPPVSSVKDLRTQSFVDLPLVRDRNFLSDISV